MHVLRFAVAVACLVAPTVASAQLKRSVRTSIDAHANNDPSYSWASRTSRDPSFRSWMSGQSARITSYAYRPVLRFAECISRFDHGAADRVLGAELRSARSSARLNFAAAANRGCAVERSLVHPLLLRAALAETLLKGSEAAAVSGHLAPVGVPAIVDGYPLSRIAGCQVSQAPALVRALLATDPGSADEQKAAQALFGGTPACGAPTLGRLSPTAARLAVIEAAYARRFVAAR